MPASPRVIDVPLGAPCVPGRLDPANARHVLALLDRAIDGCTRGEFAAMVTAPVQKSIINDAGVPFTGHTEYLAARTQRAAAGDAAGRRRPARGARHHSPAAACRERCHHADAARLHAAHPARRRAPALGHAASAYRRVRPQSACRRKRAPRHRGPRRDPACHRPGARRGHAGRWSPAGRHGIRAALPV